MENMIKQNLIILLVAIIIEGATRQRLYGKLGVNLDFASVDQTSPLISAVGCVVQCYNSYQCNAARIDGSTCTGGFILKRPVQDFSRPFIRLYQVFRLMGTGGKHTMDQNEAEAACNDAGTTLASAEDLRAARTQGFHECGCGWLSDGGNGLVLQIENPICWATFDTNIVWCNYTKADANCKTIIM